MLEIDVTTGLAHSSPSPGSRTFWNMVFSTLDPHSAGTWTDWKASSSWAGCGSRVREGGCSEENHLGRNDAGTSPERPSLPVTVTAGSGVPARYPARSDAADLLERFPHVLC